MKAILATRIGYKVTQRTDGDVLCQHYHAWKENEQPPHDEMFDGSKYECDKCREKFIPNGGRPVYDTPSTDLEPGCLYWHELPKGMYWDNQDGPSLHAVTPDGHHWNIDSRASNCGSPNDRLHRCWVRHGEPPNIHVDKNGLTCNAGAGSIDTGKWHGYLHNGEFHV